MLHSLTVSQDLIPQISTCILSFTTLVAFHPPVQTPGLHIITVSEFILNPLISDAADPLTLERRRHLVELTKEVFLDNTEIPDPYTLT